MEVRPRPKKEESTAKRNKLRKELAASSDTERYEPETKTDKKASASAVTGKAQPGKGMVVLSKHKDEKKSSATPDAGKAQPEKKNTALPKDKDEKKASSSTGVGNALPEKKTAASPNVKDGKTASADKSHSEETLSKHKGWKEVTIPDSESDDEYNLDGLDFSSDPNTMEQYRFWVRQVEEALSEFQSTEQDKIQRRLELILEVLVDTAFEMRIPEIISSFTRFRSKILAIPAVSDNRKVYKGVMYSLNDCNTLLLNKMGELMSGRPFGHIDSDDEYGLEQESSALPPEPPMSSGHSIW